MIHAQKTLTENGIDSSGPNILSSWRNWTKSHHSDKDPNYDHGLWCRVQDARDTCIGHQSDKELIKPSEITDPKRRDFLISIYRQVGHNVLPDHVRALYHQLVPELPMDHPGADNPLKLDDNVGKRSRSLETEPETEPETPSEIGRPSKRQRTSKAAVAPCVAEWRGVIYSALNHGNKLIYDEVVYYLRECSVDQQMAKREMLRGMRKTRDEQGALNNRMWHWHQDKLKWIISDKGLLFGKRGNFWMVKYVG